jgi:hypothetical protein
MIANTNDELLTAGKLAEKLGVSAAKVKKVITELNIAPDLVKSNCSYYGTKSAEKIKIALT